MAEEEIVQQQAGAPWIAQQAGEIAQQQQQQTNAPIAQQAAPAEGQQTQATICAPAQQASANGLLPDGRPDQNELPGYCGKCGFSLYHYAGKPCNKAGEPAHPEWYSPPPPSFADVNR